MCGNNTSTLPCYGETMDTNHGYKKRLLQRSTSEFVILEFGSIKELGKQIDKLQNDSRQRGWYFRK